MTDIEQLREEEIANLSEEEEIFDLESLITDGADAKFPIRIKYPKENPDGTVRMVNAGAMIRPLTQVEWNNATRLSRKTKNNKSSTTNEVELVKKALYTRSGESFPPQLIEKMPAGVVLGILDKVAEISGIDLRSPENVKIAKEMMGF